MFVDALRGFIQDFTDSNVKQYMEKRLFVQLNGNRKVIGILRGYDVRFLFHGNNE